MKSNLQSFNHKQLNGRAPFKITKRMLYELGASVKLHFNGDGLF